MSLIRIRVLSRDYRVVCALREVRTLYDLCEILKRGTLITHLIQEGLEIDY